MANQTVKTIIDFLKGEGVEISDTAISAAEKRYSGQVLAPTDKVLLEGEVKMTEGFNQQKSKDILEFKEAATKWEAKAKELEDALLRGDNVAAKKLETALGENKRLKTIAEKFMVDQHARWAEVVKLKADGKLPEKLEGYYTFPEEGKELDDAIVIDNVAKYNEHRAIGALGEAAVPLEGPAPLGGSPKASPAGGAAAGGDAAWRDMSPSEKIKYGHEHPGKTSGASMGDVQKEG